MLMLILGGAASGKSEYAEAAVMNLAAERYYIATMEVSDGESQKRVERHRQMRQNKGFTTIEWPLDLPGLRVPRHGAQAAALLECASTLLGNELYLPKGAREAGWSSILQGVQNLVKQGLALVVVSNDVFASGEAYSPEMQEYLRQLGLLNCHLAALADEVVEVCCGIPIFHKKNYQEKVGGIILK